MYCADNGRPNRAVQTVLGVHLLKEMFNFTDGEALEQLEFNLLWHHALRLDIEETHLPQKTLHNFRVRLMQHDGGRLAFQETTDRIIQALGIRTGKQRLDSTHIMSNIATLTRLGLFCETMRLFLRALRWEHPELRPVVPEGLLGRYLKGEDEATHYEDAHTGEGRRRLSVCARDTAAADLPEELADKEVLREKVRQCALLGISRSSLYYRSRGTSSENLAVMKLIDQQYLATPFYGSRRMAVWLKRQGRPVSRKRVQRLMRSMGLQAIYRRPRTSQPASGHKVYPYLLGGMEFTKPNQVWAADITYLPMARGFLYLVAIMDWYSRYVLAWRLSNTLDADFCVEALEEALSKGRPEIFNTDQGSQFTGEAFTGLLEQHAARISMDGKGRYTDNIFVERLWRTVNVVVLRLCQ